MVRTYGAKCNNGACARATEVDGKFVFTSTIEGNDGAVVYTAAEVVSFLTDVQAGKWDTLLADARKLAGDPAIA